MLHICYRKQLLITRPLLNWTTVNHRARSDLSHIPVFRLRYWQSKQAMLQGFWKKWHQEYLITLQQRPKWTTSTPNLSIDDVVLFKESLKEKLACAAKEALESTCQVPNF